MYAPWTFVGRSFLSSGGCQWRQGGAWCVALLVCLVLPAAAGAESISVTPLSWDFGEVVVGESASKTIRVQSVEPTPLTVYSLSITDDPHGAFAIAGIEPDPIPTFLFQGDFVDALVTFTPPVAGSFAGSFFIHSNDHHEDYTTIPVVGQGIVPEPSSIVAMLLGVAGMAYVCRRRHGPPGGAWCVALLVCLVLPAMARAESASVIPLEWDFGNVVVGESASTTFRIESRDETFDLEIYLIEIEDDPLAAFAITEIDPPGVDWLLDFGEFVDVTVAFAPPSRGTFDALLRFWVNDTHSFPPYDGNIRLPLTGTAIPEPSSAVLLLVGLVAAGGWRRRRRA